jgi:hypothetical protein
MPFTRDPDPAAADRCHTPAAPRLAPTAGVSRWGGQRLDDIG